MTSPLGPTTRRLRRLISVAWILGIIVGPPALLIGVVGNPLPDRIPTWTDIGLYLRGSIPVETVISVVAVLVWVAWAWMTAGIIIQIIWLVRHREPAVRPILPLLPAWVANLVAGIGLAAATLTTSTTPRPTEIEHLPPVTVEQVTSPQPSNITPPPGEQEDGAGEVEYVTEHLDTWWHIAETTLGDGTRWSEIRELNTGRHDARGTPIGHHTTNLAAGTRLALPADAQASNPPAESEPVVAPRTESPEPGEGFNRIAMRVLADAWGRTPTWEETRPYWEELVDLNRDRVRSGDVDLIYVDEVFELPTLPPDPTSLEESTSAEDAAPEDTPAEGLTTDREEQAVEDDQVVSGADEEPAAAGTVDAGPPKPAESPSTPTTQQRSWELPPTTSTPEVFEVAPDHSEGEDGDHRGVPFLPVAAGLAGLGIVAYSLVGIIDRRRRIQLAHRPPDTQPTPPPADTQPTEQTLRAAAASDGFEFCDLALRSLSVELIANRLKPPPVAGVYLANDGLRLLLDAPHPVAPEGWSVHDDGYTWHLPRSHDLAQSDELTRGAVHPLPGLVTIGHDPTGGQLLLDLEHTGALHVSGEPVEVTATLATMAAELAGNHGIFGKVYCVGFGEDLALLERVEVVGSLAECIDEVEKEAELPEPHNTYPPLVGRNLPGGGDALAPVAVLDPSPAPPGEADRLLTLAHQGRVVLAAVGYPTGGHWTIRVGDGKVEVPEMGLTLDRRNLTSEEQTQINQIVTAAHDLDGLPTEISPPPRSPVLRVPTDQPSAVRDAVPIASDNRDAPPVYARILGNPTVTHPEGHLPAGRATSLVTYLTFHPQGVDSDRLSEALYPGEPPAGNALYAVAKRARNALGDDRDGNRYLPKADNHGVYRLSRRFRSDLADFEAHINAADQAPDPETAVAHLEAALELVTGPPFSGIRGECWVWVDSEGWRSHVAAIVDNATHRLAELALAQGDHTRATWAARKIITTCATPCLHCYKHLIRAGHLRGDQAGMDLVWKEYFRAAYDSEDTTLPDSAHTLTDPELQQMYEDYLQQDQTQRAKATG